MSCMCPRLASADATQSCGTQRVGEEHIGVLSPRERLGVGATTGEVGIDDGGDGRGVTRWVTDFVRVRMQ
jgi:hypothetical protein